MEQLHERTESYPYDAQGQISGMLRKIRQVLYEQHIIHMTQVKENICLTITEWESQEPTTITTKNTSGSDKKIYRQLTRGQYHQRLTVRC